MSDTSILIDAYLKEMEAEATATRKCLENIPAEKFEFKPHPTSMNLGYLSLLVAEIPMWITCMVEQGEINFTTFRHAEIKTNAQLVEHFDKNMEGVKKALQHVTDASLQENFYLKNGDTVLMSVKKLDYIGPTINHWIHHRGQLTVYMRISEIPVPSIYGPSGDEKNF